MVEHTIRVTGGRTRVGAPAITNPADTSPTLISPKAETQTS